MSGSEQPERDQRDFLIAERALEGLDRAVDPGPFDQPAERLRDACSDTNAASIASRIGLRTEAGSTALAC
jgi:hypothetical protein